MKKPLSEIEEMLYQSFVSNPEIVKAANGDLKRIREDARRRAPAFKKELEHDDEVIAALLHNPSQKTVDSIRAGDLTAPMLPVDLREIPSSRWREYEHSPLVMPPDALKASLNNKPGLCETVAEIHYKLAGTGWRIHFSVLTGTIHLEREEEK